MIQSVYSGLSIGDLEMFMKTKFIIPDKSSSLKGFSLFELAVVLVIMSLIAAIAARAIPTLNQQSRSIELGNELRDYTESILGRAEAERYFLAPDNFTVYPHYSNYANNNGERWGYIVSKDMTTKAGLCNIDPAQKIVIIYCKGSLANCTSTAQIDSFVEDLAFVLYSTDKAFWNRVGVYTRTVALNTMNYSMNIAQAVSATTPLSASNYGSYNTIVMKIAARTPGDIMDDTVIDVNYQEVWDKVGCPPLKSMTEGDVLNVRGASYQMVDVAYDFVPIPLNFLEADGAEYCFESYEAISADFGLAQIYERDWWRGLESAFTSSQTGSGASGGVDSALFARNSYNSNYCNRGNNRMPTVDSCSGIRNVPNWLSTGRTFDSKWFKDEPVTAGYSTTTQSTARPQFVAQHRKWFFCGGNGAWDSLHVLGGGTLEDFQIRLRPGYRGTDMSDYRRMNNRTFKSYARVPGSRAVYRQAFSMKVRGTTFIWDYGWPVSSTNP
jgi:prepilin-type N-terminal cleavage/methylation domain-containing protein